MDWSILDIVLSVVLLIFGVHGLTEGFARQLATLITFFSYRGWTLFCLSTAARISRI